MGAGEEVGKVATSAIDALKSSPMCLAVLILSCVVMTLGYLMVKGENERRSHNVEVMLQRCFPLQGQDKL